MNTSMQDVFVPEVCYDLSRCWITVEKAPYSKDAYRLMSYNLLAPDMVMKNNSDYAHIDDTLLNWGNRLNKITQEVHALNPDLLCLQEVQCNHLPQIIRRFKATTMRAYNYIFQQKLESGSDGIAIIYDMQKFELVHHRALGRTVREPNKREDCDRFALMGKFNLRSTLSAPQEQRADSNQLVKQLVVCSVHLLPGSPLGPDGRPDLVKCLRNDILKYGYNTTTGECIPIIMGGDFNFAHDTEPFRTLTTRSGVAACSQELAPVYVTYEQRQGWTGADHIFYSKGCPRHGIRLCSYYLLPLVPLARLPNRYLGSDHYSLAIKFTVF